MINNLRIWKFIFALTILLSTLFIMSGIIFAGEEPLYPENYVLRAWRGVDHPDGTYNNVWDTLNYRAKGYYEGTWEDTPRTH